MSYKNFLIAAVVDLEIGQGSSSYSINDDHTEITDHQHQMTIRVTDQIISRAVYLEKLDEVRTQRDLLLSKCDWTSLPDNALSDSQKEVWKSYRQALRDTTSTIVEGKEEEHTFPQEPFL